MSLFVSLFVSLPALWPMKRNETFRRDSETESRPCCICLRPLPRFYVKNRPIRPRAETALAQLPLKRALWNYKLIEQTPRWA